MKRSFVNFGKQGNCDVIKKFQLTTMKTDNRNDETEYDENGNIIKNKIAFIKKEEKYSVLIEQLKNRFDRKKRDEFAFADYNKEENCFICSLCGQSFPFENNKNMKQLFHHLQNKKIKQLTDFLDKHFEVNKYISNKEWLTESNDLLINFLTTTHQPLNIVDHPAFQKFVSHISHGEYQTPSRRTVTDKIKQRSIDILLSVRLFLLKK